MADTTLIVVDNKRRSTLETWLEGQNLSPNRMLETVDSVAAVFTRDRFDEILAKLPPLLTDNMVGAILVLSDEAHGGVYQGEQLAERGTANTDNASELIGRLDRFTSFTLPEDGW